ncbi:hypothetical protein GCM10010222_07500 [Streptomyces tanashiensis]|nr:hypothetical protein GCM10010222_07500 [Streptomyces tanashiensis]
MQGDEDIDEYVHGAEPNRARITALRPGPLPPGLRSDGRRNVPGPSHRTEEFGLRHVN